MSYEIPADGSSITCLRCGRTSRNPNDIARRYCGECHRFHDDMDSFHEALCVVETGLDPRLRTDLFQNLRRELRRDLLGVFTETPLDAMFATGFKTFKSPTGIHGLAKVENDRLEILALHAASPGRGQFQDFMHLAKISYPMIFIWEAWSHTLAQTLERYGFAPVSARERETGEVLDGWCWSQPFQKQ